MTDATVCSLPFERNAGWRALSHDAYPHGVEEYSQRSGGTERNFCQLAKQLDVNAAKRRDLAVRSATSVFAAGGHAGK